MDEPFRIVNSRLQKVFLALAGLALLGIVLIPALRTESSNGLQPVAAAASGTANASPFTYEQWAAACRELPSNRSLRGRFPPKDVLPIKDFGAFEKVLDAFLQLSISGSLRQATNWVGESPEKDAFFDVRRAYFQRATGGSNPLSFQPFAQKLSVPKKSQVFFRGDLHGDLHSLMADLAWLNAEGYLKGFEIARPDFFMVFLGDYTDRGVYGTEVLYTMLRLKIANPDRVFMARGNHEDLSLLLRYGFLHEGQAKFGRSFNIAKIARAYDFLPVVIYVESGGNALQCNHGGMEPGYDPKPLLEGEGAVRYHLLGALRQKDFLARHPAFTNGMSAASLDLVKRAFQNADLQDAVSPTVLGFMWNDFSVLSSEPDFAVDPDRAFIFGKGATQFVLQSASSSKHRVQAVFRAHQHSGQLTPVMSRLVAGRGVYRHWQENDSIALLQAAPQQIAKHLEHSEVRAIPTGSVWTFNVGADSAYGEGCGFAFDTFGILTTAPVFDDWRLRIVNVTPPR